MQDTAHKWALVLAAGDGRRLSTLSTDVTGQPVPKQYCTLSGGPSLLQSAIDRGRSLAGAGHVSVIVAAAHRRWWWRVLRDLPAANLIVQPDNRGTANGIMLQLLHLRQSDPEAEVVLLPSDHLVIDESVLASAVQHAFQRLHASRGKIILLGMTPVTPDPELGYIVPGPADEHGISEVLRFVEKPTPTTAALLIERGALLNTFILVARCSALLELLEQSQPALMHAMVAAMNEHQHRQTALDELYAQLPVVDFSRQVLETTPGVTLHVQAVAECGWSDLGTPERIGQAISMLVRSGRSPAGTSASTESGVNLCARYLHSLLAATRNLTATA